MPVVCADFIAFAEGVRNDSDEIALRAAISRAYYGAYHSCSEWHETKLPTPGHDIGLKGGVHQTLINQLTNPDASCGKDLGLRSTSIGYMLRDLKVVRTGADYDLGRVVDRESLANAIASAKLLIKKTEEALPPQAPSGPLPLTRIR